MYPKVPCILPEEKSSQQPQQPARYNNHEGAVVAHLGRNQELLGALKIHSTKRKSCLVLETSKICPVKSWISEENLQLLIYKPQTLITLYIFVFIPTDYCSPHLSSRKLLFTQMKIIHKISTNQNAELWRLVPKVISIKQFLNLRLREQTLREGGKIFKSHRNREFAVKLSPSKLHP